MIDLKLLNESEPIDLELKKNTGGGVNDVQVNGESIVKDGVANIPIAKGGVPGLMCVDAYANQGGLYRANGTTGLIRIQRATPTVIDERKSAYEPIVPNTLDYAVKQAMCDGKGQAWTTEEKANARNRMGLEWTLLGDVTVEEDGVTKIEIPIDNPNYNEYQFYVYVAERKTATASNLIVGFNKMTSTSYVLSYAGAGTNTTYHFKGHAMRHCNLGWFTNALGSKDGKPCNTAYNKAVDYYARNVNGENRSSETPVSINVLLATGLDIGSKFVVYAR